MLKNIPKMLLLSGVCLMAASTVLASSFNEQDGIDAAIGLNEADDANIVNIATSPAKHPSLAYTHSYTYTRLSYTKHQYVCTYGETGTQGHAVSSESYSSGNLYATCLLCGGSASMGF